MIQIGSPAVHGPNILKLALYLGFVGAIATLVAGLVGFLTIAIATFPLSIFAVLVWPIAAYFLALGLIFALPVTFLLLPAAAFFGRGHPLLLYFSLPVIGAAGGFVAMKYLNFPMMDLSPREDSVSLEMLKWTGVIAGFAAGGIFSAAVYEMRK